jgi:hypothetical protein
MPEGLLAVVVELACGAAAVFAMLYALTSRLGFDIELHKLKVDTMTLRQQYEDRVAQIRMFGGSSKG